VAREIESMLTPTDAALQVGAGEFHEFFLHREQGPERRWRPAAIDDSGFRKRRAIRRGYSVARCRPWADHEASVKRHEATIRTLFRQDTAGFTSCAHLGRP